MQKENSVKVSLPYGTGTIPCEIPKKRLAGILTSGIEDYKPEGSPRELVEAALADPVASATLKELTRGKKNVVLLASDHTRPVPSRIIVPAMLRQIREGNPDAEITILVATGCHRASTQQEILQKFGAEIAGSERIVVHDCDSRDMVRLGTLPSGGPLVINKIAAQADLLVAEGFIEPHFFAGFSGGRKSVLPGIAAREVVLANHNGAFIADPNARTGVLENNPIHKDMVYAAGKAGLAFIVNTVLNAKHEVIFAAAGDMRRAHEKGCEFLASHCGVRAVPSDIVITTNGGYPLDQNIYQSVKGMTAAEAAVKPGGVIIMASQCSDGCGADGFARTFREQQDLDALMDQFIHTPPSETIVDQWQSQILVRVLQRASVIFISDADPELVSRFHMIPAGSIAQALEMADGILGRKDGMITVIPDGVGVCVY